MDGNKIFEITFDKAVEETNRTKLFEIIDVTEEYQLLECDDMKELNNLRANLKNRLNRFGFEAETTSKKDGFAIYLHIINPKKKEEQDG